jgi:MarR family transcriptional regulator, organic hydroperoxide resistance regulator
MPSSSNEKRSALYADLNRAVRLFIAGSSLYSQRVAEKLRLHPTDLQFLNVLELMGPLTPKVLGHLSGLSSGGVTVVVDRLQQAGYVKRQQNPADGRSFLVNLVPSKFRKVTAHYETVEQQFRGLLKDASDSELETVMQFFAKMNAARASTRQ